MMNRNTKGWVVFVSLLFLSNGIANANEILPNSGDESEDQSVSSVACDSSQGNQGSQDQECDHHDQLDSEEMAFLSLINDYRAQNGAGPLQISSTLSQASEWLSNDMASKNYFSHTDSLGRSFSTRLKAFGYPSNSTRGENIAAGNSTAQKTFTQWRNSAPHNKNMLNPKYKVIGIGRAYNKNSRYKWYWTTDFGSVMALENQ